MPWLFLEFLVIPEAQTVFAEGNNEYPVVEGVNIDPIVAELGEFKVDSLNVAAYSRNNLAALTLADRADWE
ncbi:MAG: hypothetical protein AAFR26_04840 [Cyanobacteria bacterium J06626_4]